MSGPAFTSGPDAAASQAVLTIDLRALAANWRDLAMRVAPATCSAVVKADAYGIGIEAAVPALIEAGCKVFFVAHPSEGLRVRALSPDVEIFVLNALTPEAAPLYSSARLTPVLSSLADASVWASLGGGPCALHVDTGMNRLGVSIDEIASVAEFRLQINLLMTHFVSSEDAGDALNATQIARFEEARRLMPGVRASLANSSAVFLPQQPFADLVRPGYALYGGNPTPGQDNPMRAVVTLEARLLQIRTVQVGETVGYNAQWTARRRSRIATIGIGYADGLPRFAMATDKKRGGEAIVEGVRCSFAGRVSMDLTVLDVTDVPEEAIGPHTRARLLGSDITVDDLGQRGGTIGYEILTRLGARYHRVYVND